MQHTLFADDTSLFRTVREENLAALDLSWDLGKITLCAWQWKMKLSAAKTEEVLFSCKRENLVHLVLKLGEDVLSPKSEHVHLGLILDSRLNAESHNREAISKAQK